MILSAVLVRRRLVELAPSSLPGLVAWGEGSDLGADGSSIASWVNRTGSGIDPAQSVAGNKPTVKANGINGQKAALFTAASSQGLLFPAGALGWAQNVAGFTMLCVFQPISLNRPIIVASRNADNNNRAGLQTNASKLVTQSRSDDTTLSSLGGATTLSAGVPYIGGSVFNFAGGAQSVILNGTVDGTGVIAPSQNTPNTASAGIAIGARYDLATVFDGYIAAYAMWNRALDPFALQAVTRRWSKQFGTPFIG